MKTKLHQTAEYPFQKVAVDITGLLTPTKKGNRFIISFVDSFSRYIILSPLREMKSVDLAKIMKEKAITQFGIPEEFVTDGGSNFTSAYMKKFFDENGIKHLIFSPNHATV